MLPYTTPVAQLHSPAYSQADMDKDDFVPSDAQMTSIVLPTIVFCIGMVVAMLVGINKCKQWDLDRIVEMRRTRRVVQRITARLREKNFKTIQKARNVRKRAAAAAKAGVKQGVSEASPPLYSSQQCGSSPPPSYEDALLDEYYFECHPSNNRQLATRRSSTQSRSSKRSNPTTARRRAAHQNSNSSSKGVASTSDILPV